MVVVIIVLALGCAGAYLWMDQASDAPAGHSLLKYSLLAANVLFLAAVLYALVRYLGRLLSERHAGVLGSRFKFKLVATFFGLVLIPALVLYGSAIAILFTAIDRALTPDVNAVVSDAQALAAQFVDDEKTEMAEDVRALAQRVVALPLEAGRESQGILRSWLEQGRFASALVIAEDGTTTFVETPAMAGRHSPLHDPWFPEQDLATELGRVRGGGHFVRTVETSSKAFLVAGVPLGPSSATSPSSGLVVARRVPSDVAKRLERLVVIAQEHDRLTREEPWLKAEQALRFFALLLVVCLGATWTGLYIARGVTIPIQRLAEATVELRRGNLAHVVDWKGTDELAMLVGAFNEMAADLRAKAVEVEGKTSQLQDANVLLEAANAELERRRSHMERLLATMSAGVLAVDAQGRVTVANPAVAQILELPAGAPAGGKVEDVLSSPALEALRLEIAQALRRPPSRRELSAQVELARGLVQLQVVLAAQPDAQGGPGLLVLFEDVTELVRAQKLATWRAAARRIAHEIKNPLTPIQLSAQRILKKFRERAPDLPAVLESGVATIVAEVSGLKQMVDEFSDFARMPEVRPALGDVAAMLESVRALYVGHESLKLTVDIPEPLPPVSFDPELLRRAVVNLVDNAVEATGARGRVQLRASVVDAGALLRVEVCDDGPGIPPADRDKLFLPYFTTRREGTGLGLAIVSRIVADHGGRVRVDDNVPRGSRFVVEIPADGRPSASAPSGPPSDSRRGAA